MKPVSTRLNFTVNMNAPWVSILINNYNYGRFLAEAIDSALHQTTGNVEVIVVDDGSTDRSRALIETYGERIKPVLKENGGQASAFNAGFEASRGDIICFLDADDWFTPNKVAVIIAKFTENPAYGWLVHHLMPVDNDRNPVTIFEAAQSVPAPAISGDYTEIVKSGKLDKIPGLPATSGLCFKRQTLERILPVPLALRITADNYLKCAALMSSPLLVVDETLAYQRIHGMNAYTNKDRQDKSFRKRSRYITRHIASGLYSLNKGRQFPKRLVLRNLKMALKDRDLIDAAINLKDLLFYGLCRFRAVSSGAHGLR